MGHHTHDDHNHWDTTHEHTEAWHKVEKAHHQEVPHASNHEASHVVEKATSEISQKVGIRLSLGEVGRETKSLWEALSWTVNNIGSVVIAILDAAKETGGHFSSAYKDIKEEKTTIGKVTYWLSSFLKVPLNTLVSLGDMFSKQLWAGANMIANLTSWNRIPSGLANFIRAPFSALEWILKQKKYKEAHAHS